MEDFFVPQIKAFGCWRISSSRCLIMVFPFRKQSAFLALETFHDQLLLVSQHSEYAKTDHQEESEDNEEVALSSDSLIIKLKRVQAIGVGCDILDKLVALIFAEWSDLSVFGIISSFWFILAWLACSS